MSAEMMYSEGVELGYYAEDNYQWIEVLYGNGQCVMDILLPNNSHTIDKVLEEFTITSLNELIEKSENVTRELFMPKFKIEYKKSLKNMLIDMGMEKAFNQEADFSKLFKENMGLYISEVLHQAVIGVDEKGTEAAAATVVLVEFTNSVDPSKIRLNRPFAFFIREKHSNVILFTGKLQNPIE